MPSERPPPFPDPDDDDEDVPPESERTERRERESVRPESVRPEGEREHREGARRIVERLIREGVRRAVEKGYERVTEGPENIRQLVQDLKLPREIASLMLQQVDETKNGLYRAVARELRDFLEQTNLAEEIVRALTTLSFEIKTEIRFIPNEMKPEKLPRPDVKASVRVKDGRDRENGKDKEHGGEKKDKEEPE